MATANKEQIILDWCKTNPYLTDTLIINYLNAEKDSCAIITIPTEALPKNIDGSQEVTYDFEFQVMFPISGDTDSVNADNMLTLRTWQEWIEEQEEQGNYPDFGNGYHSYRLQNLSTAPQLAQTYADGMAKYRLPVRLNYTEE